MSWQFPCHEEKILVLWVVFVVILFKCWSLKIELNLILPWAGAAISFLPPPSLMFLPSFSGGCPEVGIKFKSSTGSNAKWAIKEPHDSCHSALTVCHLLLVSCPLLPWCCPGSDLGCNHCEVLARVSLWGSWATVTWVKLSGITASLSLWHREAMILTCSLFSGHPQANQGCPDLEEAGLKEKKQVKWRQWKSTKEGEEYPDSGPASRSRVCRTSCSFLLSVFFKECNKIICTKRAVDLSQI